MEGWELEGGAGNNGRSGTGKVGKREPGKSLGTHIDLSQGIYYILIIVYNISPASGHS